jgi:SAM-dependent methyltransferase
MAHDAQRNFCCRVQSVFPRSFVGKRVLDCGSMDVNGTNRGLFVNCEYTGIDLAEGENVDQVCLIEEYLPGQLEIYDTIICTEVFEHDKRLEQSVKRIVELLKPDGLFLFTCAANGRPEHGTVANDPDASPGTAAREGWQDFYRPLSINQAIEIGRAFKRFAAEIDRDHHDLYFWGKGLNQSPGSNRYHSG